MADLRALVVLLTVAERGGGLEVASPPAISACTVMSICAHVNVFSSLCAPSSRYVKCVTHLLMILS